MSRAKRRYIATIAVFGTLSLASLIYLVVRPGDRIAYQLPSPASLDSSEVDTVIIERPSGVVTLTRIGDGWHVSPGDYPGDAAAIRYVLDTILSAEITDVVSQRGDPSAYDLDPESRVRVTLGGGGDTLQSMDIGGSGATLSATYVVIPGDSRIFRAHGDLRGVVDRDADYFRDKLVLAFDPTRVTRIQLESGARVVRATRSGESWSTDAGETLDTEAVGRAIAFLSDLSAYRFRYSDDPMPGRWLRVQITGDQTYWLEIGGKEGNTYPATSSGSPYQFQMLLFQASLISGPFGLEPPNSE